MCKRRIISLSLVIAMLCSVCFYRGFAAKAASAETREKSVAVLEDRNVGEDVELAVITEDGKICTPLSVSCKGHVTGYGVRLRKGASLTSTVLELMQYGEVILIYPEKSKLSSGWYYVKRVKTGTKGYVSTQYVSL